MNSIMIKICALAGLCLAGVGSLAVAQENPGMNAAATNKASGLGHGVIITNYMQSDDAPESPVAIAPAAPGAEREMCEAPQPPVTECETPEAPVQAPVASPAVVGDAVPAAPAPVKDRKASVQPKYAFGVHVGLDLGAAAPWPPANMRADVMKMRAVPKLSPSLGISFTARLPKRFSVSAELTLKQVGIDADAWVSGQEFRVPNPDGADLITRFRGTANVMMNFSMLELPVYVGYGFNNGRSRIYLGAYYSYILKSSFNTVPLKGLVDNPDNPSEPPIMVTPDKPVPSDVMPVFSNYLGKWDAGILLGYEWQIVPRVNMTARFSMGFKDIFRQGSNYLEYKMLHMRGSIMLSYSLLRYNDKIFKKSQEDAPVSKKGRK